MGAHASPPGSASRSGPRDLPLRLRLRLHHAALQGVARETGLRVLHVKGDAAPPGLYREGRSTSDADVLVEPARAEEYLAALHAAGWRIMTHFETGSHFQHAAVLVHEELGQADVHRHFPGPHLSHEEMFTTLWASRTERAIAHVLCPVPDDLDHAALILTHTARDRARGAADLRSLEEWAGPERFDRIVQRCRDWGAGTAADLALGLPVAPSAYPDDALWAMEDREVDRLGRWLARWRAADSWPGRVGLVRSTIGINRDHLRMQLGHEPSPAEIRAAHRERLAEMARNALARVKPGTRGGATP